jgi:aspartyl protease family protein
MRASSALSYVAFWILLGVIAYLGFDVFLSPNVAKPIVADADGIVTIDRSHDQHFYVQGKINGHPVDFMVDTGATLVSVSEETARAIGLGNGFAARFETAAGHSLGQIVPQATVQVGGIRIDGIRVGIMPAGTKALLGQNFLNKLELSQDPRRMTLRTRRQ